MMSIFTKYSTVLLVIVFVVHCFTMVQAFQSLQQQQQQPLSHLTTTKINHVGLLESKMYHANHNRRKKNMGPFGVYTEDVKSTQFTRSTTTLSMLPTKTLQQHYQTTTSVSKKTLLQLVETSGGIEELTEYTETMVVPPASLSKQIRKSPSLFKMVGLVSGPVAAILGYGVLSPIKPAPVLVKTLGAVVTGIVVGTIGKSRLDAITTANVLPALASVLIERGVTNDIPGTQEALQRVREQFQITDEEDYLTLCTELYAKYLMGMVKYQPTAKTSELKELEKLQ